MDRVKLFYMEDRRQRVGNCVMWWAKNYMGYVTDLTKAHVFTEEEAAKIRRVTDTPWPKEYIDKCAAPTVDFQKMNREQLEAMNAEPQPPEPEPTAAVQGDDSHE